MSLIPNYARFPVTFTIGEGAWLTDSEGERYLDFLCGIGVTNTGHCHPHVVAAVREQAGSLLHVSNLFSTEPMQRLAARLSERALGGGVLFQNSGAEANEAALKLARKAKRGGRILSAHHGFHGRTFGALSATPQEAKQIPFAPLVPGFEAVAIEQLAAAVTDDVAGVIVEPIRGESGVLMVDPHVLRAIREACTEHEALLIFDEVQTGMGRTGELWAYEWLGVTPDVLTLAKGLGGGLPIGAVVVAPELTDVLQPGDHGSTFAGGPLVCAAANAALDVIDDAELLARVRTLGERFRAALAELRQVASVRGAGLMVGAEVDGDAPAIARRALLEQRLVLNATGPTTLRFLPPLIVSEDEIDEALARLARAF